MQRLNKLLKDQYFWYTAVSFLLTVLAAFAPQISSLFPQALHIDPQAAFYVAAYRLFLPIAATFASWRFGVRGGLLTCLALSPVVLAGAFINSKFPNIFLDLGDIAVGIGLSWMVGRRGEMNEKLIKTSRELEQQYCYAIRR